MNKISITIVLVFLNISCHQQRDIYAIKYTPVAAGKCKSDSTNTYHYTRPVRYKGSLPLLIILDSGGDGLMAVKKMQSAVSAISMHRGGFRPGKELFPGLCPVD